MMDRENQARSERLASKMGRLKDVSDDTDNVWDSQC